MKIWLFPTENDVWALCGFLVRSDRRWPRARVPPHPPDHDVRSVVPAHSPPMGDGSARAVIHMRDAQRQGTTANHDAFFKDVRKTRVWYFSLCDLYNPVRILEENYYLSIV